MPIKINFTKISVAVISCWIGIYIIFWINRPLPSITDDIADEAYEIPKIPGTKPLTESPTESPTEPPTESPTVSVVIKMAKKTKEKSEKLAKMQWFTKKKSPKKKSTKKYEWGNILTFLKYWEKSPYSKTYTRPSENWDNEWQQQFSPVVERRYVTFEDDHGGWNNMRMAFEAFYVAAVVTGRTLVLPPACRMYLLDRGPITLFKKNRSSVSMYTDYFSQEAMEERVPIITTQEFIKREHDKLKIPNKFVNKFEETLGRAKINGYHTEWFLYLRTISWIWPSGPQPMEMEEGAEIYSKGQIIHFPMHSSRGLRYLSGFPPMIEFEQHTPLGRACRRLIRQNMHYKESFFDIAARVIQRLGGIGGYSALHIRRNELQFKEAFLSGKETFDNIHQLLRSGEKLYISTDETSPQFFQVFKDAGFSVYMLDSFKKPKKDIANQQWIAGGYALAKHQGMIEQIICAGGRKFIGTKRSTFSNYITRLRGYIHTNDSSALHVYTHTKKYDPSLPHKDHLKYYPHDQLAYVDV